MLLMTKIDKAHKNYLTPRNLRENAFRGRYILLRFDFSTKQYDLYWPPC